MSDKKDEVAKILKEAGVDPDVVAQTLIEKAGSPRAALESSVQAILDSSMEKTEAMSEEHMKLMAGCFVAQINACRNLADNHAALNAFLLVAINLTMAKLA